MIQKKFKFAIKNGFKSRFFRVQKRFFGPDRKNERCAAKSAYTDPCNTSKILVNRLVFAKKSCREIWKNGLFCDLNLLDTFIVTSISRKKREPKFSKNRKSHFFTNY